jgi:hypothetical protein
MRYIKTRRDLYMFEQANFGVMTRSGEFIWHRSSAQSMEMFYSLTLPELFSSSHRSRAFLVNRKKHGVTARQTPQSTLDHQCPVSANPSGLVKATHQVVA